MHLTTAAGKCMGPVCEFVQGPTNLRYIAASSVELTDAAQKFSVDNVAVQSVSTSTSQGRLCVSVALVRTCRTVVVTRARLVRLWWTTCTTDDCQPAM